MTYQEIVEEAMQYVSQRAREEGDVDIDRDYEIIEKWFDEYFTDLCKEVNFNLKNY